MTITILTKPAKGLGRNAWQAIAQTYTSLGHKRDLYISGAETERIALLDVIEQLREVIAERSTKKRRATPPPSKKSLPKG